MAIQRFQHKRPVKGVQKRNGQTYGAEDDEPTWKNKKRQSLYGVANGVANGCHAEAADVTGKQNSVHPSVNAPVNVPRRSMVNRNLSSQEVFVRSRVAEPQVRDALDELVEQIEASGQHLLDALSRLDENHDGELDMEEFRVGLMGIGVALSEEEYADLFAALDTDSSGSLEFLVRTPTHPSPARMRVCRRACAHAHAPVRPPSPTRTSIPPAARASTLACGARALKHERARTNEDDCAGVLQHGVTA